MYSIMSESGDQIETSSLTADAEKIRRRDGRDGGQQREPAVHDDGDNGNARKFVTADHSRVVIRKV